MARHLLTRRSVLAGLAVAIASGRVLAGDEVKLDWNDLLPAGGSVQKPAPRGIVGHDAGNLLRQQPASTGVRTDWNGKVVRLAGYVVPLEFSGSGVTTFILVPYVGACIHVPPPPADQLVLVTTASPYESSDMYQAVAVTGVFQTAAISSELADIGYAMTADKIVPYYM